WSKLAHALHVSPRNCAEFPHSRRSGGARSHACPVLGNSNANRPKADTGLLRQKAERRVTEIVVSVTVFDGSRRQNAAGAGAQFRHRDAEPFVEHGAEDIAEIGA